MGRTPYRADAQTDEELCARSLDRVGLALYVMNAGRIVAGGLPDQVLTPDLITEVYGVRAVHRTQLVFERLKEER